MPQGARDFNQRAADPTILDLGEAASRINGRMAASLARSPGSMHYVEEFEDAIAVVQTRWNLSVVGTGTNTIGTPQWRGLSALRMTTSATTNDSNTIAQQMPAFLTRWGIEAYLDLRGGTVATNNYTVQFEMDYNPGNGFERQFGRIQIANSSGVFNLSVLERLAGVNTLTQFASISPAVGSTVESFHWLKMTINPVRLPGSPLGLGLYGFFWFDDLQYDLRSHLLADNGAQTTDGAWMQPLIKLVTNSAAAKSLGVDDLIITHDEPL